jgi:hypothetical protein
LIGDTRFIFIVIGGALGRNFPSTLKLSLETYFIMTIHEITAREPELGVQCSLDPRPEQLSRKSAEIYA